MCSRHGVAKHHGSATQKALEQTDDDTHDTSYYPLLAKLCHVSVHNTNSKEIVYSACIEQSGGVTMDRVRPVAETASC